MASPARAAARARVAELDREGLRYEELPSGREWAIAVRRWARATARELGRCTGLRLTLLEIAFYCAAHVGIVDCRALSVIARKRKITRRRLCAGLVELEERGYVLRVFRAGVRLARDERGRVVEVQPDDERVLHNVQRGSETSALLPVGLVKFVALMPPARERKARAFLAEFALKDPRVRAAIAAKGNTIPGGIPRSPPPPQAGSAGDVTTGPAGLVRMLTSASIGSETLQSLCNVPIPDRFCAYDRSPLTPPRFRAVEREEAEGAVAPIPPIASSAASTVPESPPSPAPPAAGERQGGPRLVPPSPATFGSDPRPPTVPPATRRAGAAGSRRESWPTHPAARQGGGSGRPRPEALRGSAVAADGDQLRATLRRSWGLVAGGADFLGSLATLRFASRAWNGKLLVVRMAGPPEALEQLERYRTELEAAGGRAVGVPVRVAWEAGP